MRNINNGFNEEAFQQGRIDAATIGATRRYLKNIKNGEKPRISMSEAVMRDAVMGAACFAVGAVIYLQPFTDINPMEKINSYIPAFLQ